MTKRLNDTNAALCALLLIPVMLVISACPSSNKVIAAIENGAEIVLQIGAISGVLPPVFLAYVGPASSCLDFASTEANSGDAIGVESSKITAACIGYVRPVFPAGSVTDQELALAQKLSTDIANVLAGLPAPSTIAAARVSEPVKLSEKDRSRLAAAHEKLLAARKTIAEKHI